MDIAATASNKDYLLKIIHDFDAESPRDWDNLSTMVCWHRRYSLGDKHDYNDPQEFLRSITSDSLTAMEIISYVKAGKVKGLELTYNKSAREWELKSYSEYFKKWYTEYTAKAPLSMDDEYLANAILNEMKIDNLRELVERKNCILPLYLYDHSIQSISVSSFIGRAVHAEWDSGQVGFVYVSHTDIEKEYGAVNEETIEKAISVMTAEVKTYDCYMRGNVYGFQLFECERGAEVDSCWGFVGDFDEVVKDIKGYLPDDAADLADDMYYGKEACA